MVERRLEYFEDQLLTSAFGREVLNVIENHREEVMYLINNNRPVKVAWNRNKGPKFIKSFVDSGFDGTIPYEKEIEGTKLTQLLLGMSETLMDSGSVQLKADIGKYAPMVFKTAEQQNTLAGIIYMINSIKIDKS